ncbi:MAG: DUF1631 family protein [Candidatus Sedimenticola endophacoides]
MERITTEQGNRRCYRRTAVSCPATLSIDDKLYTECTITNFPKGGLYVDTGTDTAPSPVSARHEALIEISAQVAGVGSRFLVPVVISHVDDGGGVGVSFVQEKLKPQLVSYLLATRRPDASTSTLGEVVSGDGVPRDDLIAALASALHARIERHSQEMIVELRNALFDAADRAPDDLTQGALFHGIRLLDQRGEEIVRNLLSITGAGVMALAGLNACRLGEDPEGSVSQALELVDEADFEEWVAVVGVSRRAEQTLESEIHTLEALLASVLGVSVMAERDPFSPYSLLWSFKQALDPFGLELVAKKAIYQAFTAEMFGGLGALYRGLARILRVHGAKVDEPRPVVKAGPLRRRATDRGPFAVLSRLLGMRDRDRNQKLTAASEVIPSQRVERHLDQISLANRHGERSEGG